MYNVRTLANTAAWFTGSCEESRSQAFSSQDFFPFLLFLLLYLYERMGSAEPILVTVSQDMQIKPSCCLPQTYTVVYVDYFSIKLGRGGEEWSWTLRGFEALDSVLGAQWPCLLTQWFCGARTIVGGQWVLVSRISHVKVCCFQNDKSV